MASLLKAVSGAFGGRPIHDLFEAMKQANNLAPGHPRRIARFTELEDKLQKLLVKTADAESVAKLKNLEVLLAYYKAMSIPNWTDKNREWNRLKHTELPKLERRGLDGKEKEGGTLLQIVEAVFKADTKLQSDLMKAPEYGQIEQAEADHYLQGLQMSQNKQARNREAVKQAMSKEAQALVASGQAPNIEMALFMLQLKKDKEEAQAERNGKRGPEKKIAREIKNQMNRNAQEERELLGNAVSVPTGSLNVSAARATAGQGGPGRGGRRRATRRKARKGPKGKKATRRR
jgi:hypothetical protein